MKITQVKGNTFCIDTGMSYIPFYKIDDEQIILLDSGWATGERPGIERLFEQNSLKVAGIISSHAHVDHVGNNAYFKQKYNAIIAMTIFEAMVCSSTINLKVYFSNQTLTQVTKHLGEMVCDTDIMIANYQNKINICGITFKILHTPGHSPAHICIVTPDDVAYLGDTLISHEVMQGAKMPYAYILQEDLKSKEKLRELKCRKYIVTHKGIYDNIDELITENIKFYKFRAERISSLIQGKMTYEEIMRAAIIEFNLHITTTNRFAAIERMLKSYVEYLNETCVIKLILDDGFLKYHKA